MTYDRKIVVLAILAAFAAPALALQSSAQTYPYVPAYTTWQPGWDGYRYDRHHVVLGVVAGFTPYRLTVQRRNGEYQTVDLKNGTSIYPIGSTPVQGERAAIVGYYSNGTFIANRVVLRP